MVFADLGPKNRCFGLILGLKKVVLVGDKLPRSLFRGNVGELTYFREGRRRLAIFLVGPGIWVQKKRLQFATAPPAPGRGERFPGTGTEQTGTGNGTG